MRFSRGFALALLALSPVERVVACSCGPAASAPACEKLANAEVIFLGAVMAVEPDSSLPLASNARIYRFRVETAYKGLPPTVEQIVVNPDNFTSCQTEYMRGVRYLVFASKLKGTAVVLAGGCHGSRLAGEAAEDIRFLEAFRANRAVNSVQGRVLQWVTEIGRPRKEEDAPVSGAEVLLRNSGVV
jgi:hypothetical protein